MSPLIPLSALITLFLLVFLLPTKELPLRLSEVFFKGLAFGDDPSTLPLFILAVVSGSRFEGWLIS